MKKTRIIAAALAVFMAMSSVVYADAALNKEIIALELEIVKMETKTGEYAGMSDKQLDKKKAKAKKDLEKKKAKAKKEAEKDKEALKKDIKKTGKDIKKAFD